MHVFNCRQPEFCGWAYNVTRGEPMLEKWNMIPDNTDILITHGPALGYGDLCSSQLRAGCSELLSTIQQRVKPLVHVFGHIHEGRNLLFIPSRGNDEITRKRGGIPCELTK